MKPPVGGNSKGSGTLRDRDILRSRNTKNLKPENPNNSNSNLPQCGASSTPPTGSSLGTSESPTTSGGHSTSPEGEGGGGKGAEMRMYLEKLRDMVPYAPSSGRINKVDLIHSAIDYISDLQEALEARARRKLREKSAMQSQRAPLAALPTAAHSTPNTTPLHENGTNRPPTQLEANTSHPDAIVTPSSSSSISTNTHQSLPNRTTRSPMIPSTTIMNTERADMNIPVLQNLDGSNDELIQRTLESVISLNVPSDTRTRTSVSQSDYNVNNST